MGAVREVVDEGVFAVRGVWGTNKPNKRDVAAVCQFDKKRLKVKKQGRATLKKMLPPDEKQRVCTMIWKRRLQGEEATSKVNGLDKGRTCRYQNQSVGQGGRFDPDIRRKAQRSSNLKRSARRTHSPDRDSWRKLSYLATLREVTGQ